MVSHHTSSIDIYKSLKPSSKFYFDLEGHFGLIIQVKD